MEKDFLIVVIVFTILMIIGILGLLISGGI